MHGEARGRYSYMSQFLKLVKNQIKRTSTDLTRPCSSYVLMRATVLGLAVLLACGVGVAGEDILGRVALWPGAPKDGLKVCWDGEHTDVPPCSPCSPSLGALWCLFGGGTANKMGACVRVGLRARQLQRTNPPLPALRSTDDHTST